MIREGREVWSQTDYILVMYCGLFRNVYVRYPSHNSYHYMILGFLRNATLREHTK